MTDSQYLSLKTEIEALRSQITQIRTWLLVLTFAVLGVGGSDSLIRAFGQ